MSLDHEAVQEMLAARALHALDDAERVEADAAIAAHLRGCDECREAAEGLEAVAADLALVAPPRRPPRLLEGRLRREIRVRGPRRRSVPDRWVAGVVASVLVAAVAGLAIWNAHLTDRVTTAEQRSANTAELIATVSNPASRTVPLITAPAGGPRAQVSAAYIPGHRRLYLFGYLPEPSPGRVYEVWLARNGVYWDAGTFLPDERGLVFVRIVTDPRRFDTLLVTLEPAGGAPAPTGPAVVTAQL